MAFRSCCIDDVPQTLPDLTQRSLAAAASRFAETAPRGSTNGAVDSFVQEIIVGTNGNLYGRIAGRLPRYPIPEMRLPPAREDSARSPRSRVQLGALVDRGRASRISAGGNGSGPRIDSSGSANCKATRRRGAIHRRRRAVHSVSRRSIRCRLLLWRAAAFLALRRKARDCGSSQGRHP